MRDVSYKQVIVVRSDLEMGRGKIAAQTGHAAVSAAEEARKLYPICWRAWLSEGQCKIVVRVRTEKELLILEEQTRVLGLPSAMIYDEGLTQLPPGTATCLGIGPAPSKEIDKITGKLTLL